MTWLRSDASTGEAKTLWGSVPNANGTFKAPAKLSPSGRWLQVPQVAMNAKGEAALIWSRRDTPRPTVELRTRSATGTLGNVIVASRTARVAADPDITINAKGGLAAAWATAPAGTFTNDIVDGMVGP